MKTDWTPGALDGLDARSDALASPAVSRWLRACVWSLFLAGTLARLTPLLDVKNRLYWLFMSEDGYLMQTIARNIALGLGMSTAEGTIPTNGVQPLATYLYAALHALAGASKPLAIGFVTVFSTAVAAIAAWLLWRLGRSVLRESVQRSEIAALAAALWFASPLVIKHSMNGLETGLYYLAIVGTLLYYFSLDLARPVPMSARERVVFGLLLGVAFLARNDAVFFIAAVLFTHVVLGGRVVGGGFGRRLGDAVVAGGLSLIVASPWLIHNKLLFGSVVPISGTAESHSAAFGANLRIIAAHFLESAGLYVPIPQALEGTWLVIIVSVAALVALGAAAWRLVGCHSLRGARLCLLTLLFAACIGGYYGLFFGAAWFVSRYVSALSPMLALLSVATVYFVLGNRLAGRRSFTVGVAAVATLLLFVSVGRSALHYRSGVNNGHRQVVEWVEKNIDERQWVGAIQTGTLSYFHDRTLNLDGKVNPNALRARLAHGQVMSYVLDDTPINYLADWSGLASWATTTAEPRFGKAFELVVDNKAANLAVLRRVVPVATR
jgi:hypothetical protein